MSHHIYVGQGLNEVIRLIPTEELKHMQRVGRLTYQLTRIIVLDSQNLTTYCDLLEFGNVAFYHDIGKAWIPSNILTKAQQLTDEEYKTIRMHPLYAQEYLEKNPSVFCLKPSIRQLIFESAVYHHERWDGNGYPYGITEEQIPLIARITSVCDVYDAITSERPYSKARTHEMACTEIERYAGRQFDPHIASVFLKHEIEFKAMTLGNQPFL